MDTTTLLRRVKRQFGDEYGIIINDLDIFDWANEAQTKIIRNTTSNDSTITRVANTFPITVTDKVKVKRVAINNRALEQTSLPDLDLLGVANNQEGTPAYWYQADGKINLWPSPAVSDVYNVLITYAKLPTPLSLVAPYLQWVNNPPSPQLATIAADTDFDLTSLDFTTETYIDNPTSDFFIAGKGTAVTAANFSWYFHYFGSTLGNGQFRLTYTDGTTIRTANLDGRPGSPFVAGELFRFRIKYAPATGLVSMWRIVGGVETLSDTDDQGDVFNLPTTAGRAITFGGLTAGVGATGIGWRLTYFQLNTEAQIPLVIFDGEKDLTSLPTLPASPFLLTSGHTMAVTGNLQVLSPDNQFSVPEVYHEDIVKFCLAKAHNKNKDFRAYESSMEEFNQSVSMSRDEADTADAPSYKGVDPLDHGWEY